MEKDLFWEFSARARELHGNIEGDWDILFAMQHYGTPTRLLDWTEILGVAVYFATLGLAATGGLANVRREISPPCVWVLNPYAMNKWSGWGDDLVYPANLGSYEDLLGGDKIGWEKPVAIYPRQRNQRVHAQQAWFTIHGDKFMPIEGFGKHGTFVKKVTLPFEALPAAREFLLHAGLNHFTLFGDLPSLSKHLIEKNELFLAPPLQPKRNT